MTRSQWLELDTPEALPVYLAFNPEQKYDIWIGKIKDILTMDWSEKEKEHIESLLIFIDANKKMFEVDAHKDERLRDKVDVFQYKWFSYAQDRLGWSRKLITSIAGNVYQMKDKEGNLYIQSNSLNTILKTRSESDAGKDCNCNLTSIWYSDCEDHGCYKLQTGCGFLSFWECDGRHKEFEI